MTDLSLIPIDDIITELNKRFDAFILGTLQNTTDQEGAIVCYFHGGRLIGVGLAEHIKRRLLEEIDPDDEEENPKE